MVFSLLDYAADMAEVKVHLYIVTILAIHWEDFVSYVVIDVYTMLRTFFSPLASRQVILMIVQFHRHQNALGLAPNAPSPCLVM